MRWTLLGIACLSVACSNGSSDWLFDRPADTFDPPSSSTGPTTLERGSVLVGRAGGHVTVGGGSGVRIPAGALTSEVAISVDRVGRAPSPHDGTPVGPTYLLGPEGQAFAEPVTVTVAFDPNRLDPGETPSDIVIYTSPRDRDEFTPLETSVVDGTHVSAKTTHFSYFVATHGTLASGEYESTATNIGESPYIGDWEASGGYVLGYLPPGSKIYAKMVRDDSVYGLIPGGGYGGWDNGHHCGWVQLGKGTHIRGSGSSSPVAASCPAWDNDFSLAHGDRSCGSSCTGPGDKPHQDKSMFREGSWVVSDGVVQSAVVLPSCPDLTVYANYEPLTHTFSDPDGVEVPNRGTRWSSTEGYASAGGVQAKTGYSGFGTRFVSADGYAVEIKDTRRPTQHGESPTSSTNGKVTAFGFMKASCIAGSKVGNPAGTWPPAVPSCGVLTSGKTLHALGELRSCNDAYWLEVSATGELDLVELSVGLKWQVKGPSGDRLDMQSDGNLVLYSGQKAVWATMTNGHPGAYARLEDDGTLAVYYGATKLWSHH